MIDYAKEIARLQAASDERSAELAKFLADVRGEIDKLAAVRAWLATYPQIPADVQGDPEAMIVVRLREMLGEVLYP